MDFLDSRFLDKKSGFLALHQINSEASYQGKVVRLKIGKHWKNRQLSFYAINSMVRHSNKLYVKHSNRCTVTKKDFPISQILHRQHITMGKIWSLLDSLQSIRITLRSRSYPKRYAHYTLQSK